MDLQLEMGPTSQQTQQDVGWGCEVTAAGSALLPGPMDQASPGQERDHFIFTFSVFQPCRSCCVPTGSRSESCPRPAPATKARPSYPAATPGLGLVFFFAEWPSSLGQEKTILGLRNGSGV